jgi:hypothetical protein
LISYRTLAIPIILALVIGGIISFLVVYRFYPEKHENINLNGRCYELTGQAHEEFVKLTAQQKKNGLILQLNKIEEINASIPVTFSGPQLEVKEFINKHHIMVTSNQNVTIYPNIVGNVINGNINKTNLERIVDNLSLEELYPLSKTVAGSIGIQPNEYITPVDSKNIYLLQNALMNNGLTKIVATSDGVKSTECR